jgi:Fur family ferric uptake transcriptional regulator
MAYSTKQKSVLSDVIRHAGRPLTPGEMCKIARNKLPSLGIATVYRAIKQFIDEGSVRLVEVPGAPPHYESSARRHHHFFLCQQCQHIFDLIGCVRGVQSLAPKGFRVHGHEIVLYGECPGCFKAA